MPSKSQRQHNLMEMVAHDPAAAKRVGVPQSVGQDYAKADVGRTFDHHAHIAGQKRDAKSAPATIRTNAAGKRRAE